MSAARHQSLKRRLDRKGTAPLNWYGGVCIGCSGYFGKSAPNALAQLDEIPISSTPVTIKRSTRHLSRGKRARRQQEGLHGCGLNHLVEFILRPQGLHEVGGNPERTGWSCLGGVAAFPEFRRGAYGARKRGRRSDDCDYVLWVQITLCGGVEGL